MLRVGLTGSIATGKSTILSQFTALGVPTYSSDDAVHALYAGEASAQIESLFPGTSEAGKVDRAALAEALRAAPERINELESLIHPLVREKAYTFFDAAEAGGADIAVIEVPLLFETGANYPLDRILVAYCADAEQRARALERSGMTGDKLDMLLARQMPQDEKRKRADYVIDTTGPMEETARQVSIILSELRRPQTLESRKQ